MEERQQQPAANLPRVEGQEVEDGGPAESSDPSLSPSPPLAGPSAQQVATSFLPLLPELLPHVASFMHPNDVACGLRLVCKAADGALPTKQYTTVRLSDPSPPGEFERHWCSRPDALRSLNRKQREQLELLTALSGSVANLAALAARGDTPLLSRPAAEWGALLYAAAAAGRLEMCRWLHERGTPLAYETLMAAVEQGCTDVCEWLLDSGYVPQITHLEDALRGGHVPLFERLLQRLPPSDGLIPSPELLAAAAQGCDLPALQRFYEQHVAGRPGWSVEFAGTCIASAVISPTPDWAAKVEWLEGLGCPRTASACAAAAAEPDAVALLQWLVARGYAVDEDAADAAIRAGRAEALQYVLAQGVVLDEQRAAWYIRDAARLGHLAVAQALHATGVSIDPLVVRAALEGGHLPVVEWVVEQLGDGLPLDAHVFTAAARSGSLPLLRWLHARGCAWQDITFAAALGSCSEEALEWLVERGCPTGYGSAPYVWAVKHCDVRILCCLRRLGFAFAPDGTTFAMSVCNLDDSRSFVQPLTWLLDAGCPVDWAMAERGARSNQAMVAWIQEQRQKRDGSEAGGCGLSAVARKGHEEAGDGP